MSSPEFVKGQKVRIANSIKEEYPESGLADLIGDVEGTIPPESQNPYRVMVRIDGRAFINIRPEDLKKVDSQ